MTNVRSDYELHSIMSRNVTTLTVGTAIELMKSIENVLDGLPQNEDTNALIEFKDTLLHSAMEWVTEEEVAYWLGEL